MILNVSGRTDIAAFYTEWFINRYKDGFLDVRNPFNPKMIRDNTEYKFLELYTKNELPFGITLLDKNDNIIGFCVFKLENLKKYPDIYPWLSDIMILEEYRGRGYGRILISKGEEILKELGEKDTLAVGTKVEHIIKFNKCIYIVSYA